MEYGRVTVKTAWVFDQYDNLDLLYFVPSSKPYLSNSRLTDQMWPTMSFYVARKSLKDVCQMSLWCFKVYIHHKRHFPQYIALTITDYIDYGTRDVMASRHWMAV